MFKVPEQYRLKNARDPRFNSDSSFGNNGQFAIRTKYAKKPILYLCQASEDEGWEHVSVTVPLSKRCPTWEEMCMVKDVFWSVDDVVVQYHPAKKDYVSLHPHCLHLWRPTDQEIPSPPSILVGPDQAKK